MNEIAQRGDAEAPVLRTLCVRKIERLGRRGVRAVRGVECTVTLRGSRYDLTVTATRDPRGPWTEPLMALPFALGFTDMETLARCARILFEEYSKAFPLGQCNAVPSPFPPAAAATAAGEWPR